MFGIFQVIELCKKYCVCVVIIVLLLGDTCTKVSGNILITKDISEHLQLLAFRKWYIVNRPRRSSPINHPQVMGLWRFCYKHVGTTWTSMAHSNSQRIRVGHGTRNKQSGHEFSQTSSWEVSDMTLVNTRLTTTIYIIHSKMAHGSRKYALRWHIVSTNSDRTNFSSSGHLG